ncbi:MAG: response regulator [Desulfamplus sp.]|nr:response regulator [Desulfamplus sp.]MBF0230707.1 response regulator [Desulfamplus sp.]
MDEPRLLLVDDEAPFIEAISKRLKKRNFKVEMAFSGMEALEKFTEDGFDPEVVILDVKMPGMDGIETLEELKRKYPLVEVIMLTGHATVSSAIDGMKKGAFDYLMKPCDMEVLVTKVGEAIAKKRAQETKIVEARMKDIMRKKGLD